VAEELTLGPGTTLSVVEHTNDTLDVEARYDAGGVPPPPHFHPAQDERFEVLRGEMHAVVAGDTLTLATGDVLEIPRGTPHQIWNDGDEAAVMRWQTSPPLRTLEWFRGLVALQRGEGDIAELLAEYSDVVRFHTA
jgi:mannose-6-phosphate isomerase-like protein (cupin superfamily)